MAEHLAQLSEALADPAADASRRRRFVETFIRPRGGPAPTDLVVQAVEELFGPIAPGRDPSSSPGPGQPDPGSSPPR
jgi:hypothetical protein